MLIDALCQITGTTEKYSSAIPEPFTFIPEDQRSIALADGSITSSFLEMFGRPPRDTGLESERNNRPTAASAAPAEFQPHPAEDRAEPEAAGAVRNRRQSRAEIVDELYLTILSRFPTDEELKIVTTYAQSGGVKRREALVDLAWALINSAEFLYRH